MENFSSWFSRCTGDWCSYRRYLTLPGKKDDTYATEFTISVDGDVLHRDIGYFTDEPNDSKLERLDEDTVVLHSAYDGMEFREEIRLLNDDKNRLRQTVGFRKGKPFLVGQYWEEKVA